MAGQVRLAPDLLLAQLALAALLLTILVVLLAQAPAQFRQVLIHLQPTVLISVLLRGKWNIREITKEPADFLVAIIA